MSESVDTEKKDRSQELLQRIAEKKYVRKKRPPSILIFINVVILFIILFQYYRTSPEMHVYISVLRYSDMAHRFSITVDEAEKSLLFVVTATNESPRPVSILYSNEFAVAIIKHIDTPLQKVTFGDGTMLLNLQSKESRSFMKKIDGQMIRKYFTDHPDFKGQRRRGFLSKEKKQIPLTAEFCFNTKLKVTTELSFNYYLE